LQSPPFGCVILVPLVKLEAKGYGIKCRAIGNMLRNTLRTWRTCLSKLSSFLFSYILTHLTLD